MPLLVFGATVNVKSSEQPNAYPSVNISPEGTAGLNAGEIFTVTVGISGLVDKNLYGFDIMFKWDPSILQYLNHEVKIPAETCLEGVLHQPVREVKNEVNELDGTYWIIYSSLAPAEPFNGYGVFLTITFILLQESDGNFTFEHIFLVNDKSELIPIGITKPLKTQQRLLVCQELSEHQKLKAERWLEWWITVTWQMAKRRASAAGR